MPLTNHQKYELIRERKEREARVKAELNAGTRNDPPPLLVGLEPVSAILPRLWITKRDKLEAVTMLERVLKNSHLKPSERKRLEEKLKELA